MFDANVFEGSKKKEDNKRSVRNSLLNKNPLLTIKV